MVNLLELFKKVNPYLTDEDIIKSALSRLAEDTVNCHLDQYGNIVPSNLYEISEWLLLHKTAFEIIDSPWYEINGILYYQTESGNEEDKVNLEDARGQIHCIQIANHHWTPGDGFYYG
jgi:hypothetical protein